MFQILRHSTGSVKVRSTTSISHRLFSATPTPPPVPRPTPVDPIITQAVETYMDNKHKRDMKNIGIFLGAIGLIIGGICLSENRNHEKYRKERDDREAVAKALAQKRKDEKAAEIEMTKPLTIKKLAELKTFSAEQKQKEKDAKYDDTLAHHKKKLYEVDIEAVLFDVAKSDSSPREYTHYSDVLHKNDDEQIIYSAYYQLPLFDRLEQCTMFKSLVPDYKKHLKEDLKTDVSANYFYEKSKSNSFYKCGLKFTW
jgi:hypothetical protein